jgi:hypothetical protein
MLYAVGLAAASLQLPANRDFWSRAILWLFQVDRTTPSATVHNVAKQQSKQIGLRTGPKRSKILPITIVTLTGHGMNTNGQLFFTFDTPCT